MGRVIDADEHLEHAGTDPIPLGTPGRKAIRLDWKRVARQRLMAVHAARRARKAS